LQQHKHEVGNRNNHRRINIKYINKPSKTVGND
jgi:hypothetical protein